MSESATTTETMTPEHERQLLATGTLFHALAADPKYRKKVLSLIREAAPNVPIPELDLEGSITKEVEARVKPQQDETKKTNERLEAVEKRLAREGFKADNNLSEEELVEVETLAKDGGIAKAQTAVDYFRAKQALGTPRGTRRPPAGTAEYLDKLSKVNPRNAHKLKELATGEAVRLMTGRRAG